MRWSDADDDCVPTLVMLFYSCVSPAICLQISSEPSIDGDPYLILPADVML